MLIQQKRRAQHSRILADIGRQLQTKGKTALDGHWDGYGWRSQGCPGCVHSRIARRRQTQGRRSGGGGSENNRSGFKNLRESDSTFRDETFDLIVLCRGNLQAITDQIRQRLVELIPELLQAPLMES